VSVLAEIQNEIRSKGPMTFARFMDLALYAPDGYYEKPRPIGKAGDFYTSVSVGPLFGELLARQFSTWLRETETFQIVEAGAHDGSLARDILRWFETNSIKVEYVIVEPSSERRQWQQQTLENFHNRVRWEQNLPNNIRGVIASNELLDAMPVHRLRWDAAKRNWSEWFVASDVDKLIWRSGNVSSEVKNCVPVVTEQLAEVLPDGFSV
jgi:SAM-dependent MidA family methyltransferase